MSRRMLAFVGLMLVDLGVFVTAVALLPLRSSWGSNGAWSYFVNSRDRWDIAWCLFAAAIVLSTGAFFLLESLGALGEKEPPAPTPDEIRLMKYLAARGKESTESGSETIAPQR